MPARPLDRAPRRHRCHDDRAPPGSWSARTRSPVAPAGRRAVQEGPDAGLAAPLFVAREQHPHPARRTGTAHRPAPREWRRSPPWYRRRPARAAARRAATTRRGARSSPRWPAPCRRARSPARRRPAIRSARRHRRSPPTSTSSTAAAPRARSSAPQAKHNWQLFTVWILGIERDELGEAIGKAPSPMVIQWLTSVSPSLAALALAIPLLAADLPRATAPALSGGPGPPRCCRPAPTYHRHARGEAPHHRRTARRSSPANGAPLPTSSLQHFPNEAAPRPASGPTVRVLYDDCNVYVGNRRPPPCPRW